MISRELLEKFRKGECTPDELAQIQAEFQQQEAEELKSLLAEDWDEVDIHESVPEDMESRVWNRITTNTSEGKNKKGKVVRLNRWAVAASIVLLISAGITWFWMDNQQASGTEITMERLEDKGLILKELADGSRVWLSQGSVLAEATDFGETERKVQLVGEAFFEVKRDVSRPFIVQSGAIFTKVLGTAFNVKAFPDRSSTEVALVEGKVEVQIIDLDTVMLKPGQAIAYDQEKKAHQISSFKGEQPFTWKNSMIYFDKADVEEVTNTLAKWYDVQFTIQDEAKIQTELVHRIDLKTRTLEQVLAHIERVADYTFTKQNDYTYIVRLKK